MGLFSYICPMCKKSVRIGEVAHLRHIRHGEVLGETVGRYDGYGRASGDYSPAPRDIHYRQDNDNNKNSHQEIWLSEFKFTDSEGYKGKVYEGKPYDWGQLRKKFNIPMDEVPPDSFYELWESLPDYKQEKIASGSSVYHEYCYKKLTEDERELKVISTGDPDQGCGTPRKKYI